MERARTGVRILFRRSIVKIAPAPKADELLNLCMEKIQDVFARYSGWRAEDDDTKYYLMNRHQCEFLVEKLAETRGSLQKIQLSPLLDEKTIPVLEELHQVLQDVETVIHASRITSSEWPRAAIEQSDMKETFARLLYGVQWHASVLLSILVDNSRESSITFEPSSCEGELSVGDEFSLLTAMKEDQESLKDRLGSVKLDDPTENRFAEELLKLKMRSEEEDLPSSVIDDSTGFISSPDLLFLNPQDLDFSGKKVGTGMSAQVQETNLVGGKYAMKIFKTCRTKAFDQEMDALQRLGHHPHIVRLMGYSKERQSCCLIMELMDKDLQRALFDISSDRERMKLSATRPLSDVQAVSLMLQIGEGVKYIHSKGMAHRDLKCGNILVDLADPSSKRISSVKIADFGLTKTKNASQTHSNLTNNEGTTLWMAPEVMGGNDQRSKSRFNPRKADVYSFAIVCVEILTGEQPYYDVDLPSDFKEQLKGGSLRPNLPGDCPPKLAALIRRCWHRSPQERPLFPEICKELRFILGLLLRSDHGKLEIQDVRPLAPGLGPGIGLLEGAQFQGPWGGIGGGHVLHMGTSIDRMKFTFRSPGMLGSMEMNYTFAGRNFERKCNCAVYGDQSSEIVFELSEYITHISGYVSEARGVLKQGEALIVASLTIHTNIRSYGPFGDERGDPFASEKGRVIGFHGRSGYALNSLGVVVILDDTS